MSYVSSCRHWCDEEAWNCYDPTIVGQDLIWFEDPMGYYTCMEIKVTVAIDAEVSEDALFVNQVTIESNLPLVDVDPYPKNNLSLHDPDLINIFLPLFLE